MPGAGRGAAPYRFRPISPRGGRAPAGALLLACLLASPAPAAGADRAPDPDVLRALSAVAEVRRRLDPAAAPTEDTWLALTLRGRPALEVKGRYAGGNTRGTLRDQSIFDGGTGRVTSFVWFPHASARKAGEPIISLSEASSRADAYLRRLLPGAELPLAGITRYRASGQEGVYYEAGFAEPGGEVPFLEPPVRLLLDASTGNLFRFDVEPAWFAPPRVPASRLSRKAAERVAAVALGARDLAPALGAGAALGKVGAAELFVVRPNNWPAAPAGGAAQQARVAWVVPFSLAHEPSRAVHRLFVDAASGKVVGGLPGAR